MRHKIGRSSPHTLGAQPVQSRSKEVKKSNDKGGKVSSLVEVTEMNIAPFSGSSKKVARLSLCQVDLGDDNHVRRLPCIRARNPNERNGRSDTGRMSNSS